MRTDLNIPRGSVDEKLCKDIMEITKRGKIEFLRKKYGELPLTTLEELGNTTFLYAIVSTPCLERVGWKVALMTLAPYKEKQGKKQQETSESKKKYATAFKYNNLFWREDLTNANERGQAFTPLSINSHLKLFPLFNDKEVELYGKAHEHHAFKLTSYP